MVQIEITIKIPKEIFMEGFNLNMVVRPTMEVDRQLTEEAKQLMKLEGLQWRKIIRRMISR